MSLQVGQAIPHNGNARFLEGRESELSVLGAVFLDPAALDRIAGTLDAVHMHDPRHRLVYGAMLLMRSKGEPIDPMSVGAALDKQGVLARAGGFDYLLALAEASASSLNIKHHAKVVRDCADVRALCDAMGEVGQRANSGDYESSGELVSMAMDKLASISQGQEAETLIPLQAGLKAAVARAAEAHKAPGALRGLSTGLHTLDRLNDNLQPGRLTVLAARPAMGKTALAVNMAIRVALAGVSVAVFSLEMPAEQLYARILSDQSQVPADRMESGCLTDGDIDRMLQQVKKLSTAPLFVDEKASATVAHVRQTCGRINAKPDSPPLGLVVIDYLQLMKGDTKNGREREIADITRDLKELAKSLKVPVVLLSQLNRKVEERADKRPLLSDLRESGAIEQDADAVLMLYRDDYYNENSEHPNTAEALLRKNRHGPTGMVRLTFRGECTRFGDMEGEG